MEQWWLVTKLGRMEDQIKFPSPWIFVMKRKAIKMKQICVQTACEKSAKKARLFKCTLTAVMAFHRHNGQFNSDRQTVKFRFNN